MTPEQAQQLLTMTGSLYDLVFVGTRLLCVLIGIGLFAVAHSAFRIP